MLPWWLKPKEWREYEPDRIIITLSHSITDSNPTPTEFFRFSHCNNSFLTRLWRILYAPFAYLLNRPFKL